MSQYVLLFILGLDSMCYEMYFFVEISFENMVGTANILCLYETYNALICFPTLSNQEFVSQCVFSRL